MGLTVSGGIFKGRKLKAPRRSGILRPTSGKVREALFSIIGSRIIRSRFLDLFSGTGAVGIEAVSRGAEFALLIENSAKNFPLLQNNCRSFHHSGIKTLNADALAILQGKIDIATKFNLVFLDPPFSMDFSSMPERALKLTAQTGCVVVQYPVKSPPDWVAKAGKLKKYGESGLAFFYNSFHEKSDLSRNF